MLINNINNILNKLNLILKRHIQHLPCLNHKKFILVLPLKTTNLQGDSMSRKFLLLIFVLLIIILSNPTVVALKSSGTTNYEREIDSNDYFWGYFSTFKEERDMSDEVDVEFVSNIPVDLYIFKSGDFNLNSPDYSKADYSEEGITDSEFSYHLEEDISYTLVISNPNYNKTASINCKITEYFGFSDDDENDVLIFGSWAMLILTIVVVVIVIIIAVIYFIIKTRKDRERDYRSFFQESQSAKPYDQSPPQQQYSYPDYYSQQRPPEPPYKKY